MSRQQQGSHLSHRCSPQKNGDADEVPLLRAKPNNAVKQQMTMRKAVAIRLGSTWSSFRTFQSNNNTMPKRIRFKKVFSVIILGFLFIKTITFLYRTQFPYTIAVVEMDDIDSNDASNPTFYSQSTSHSSNNNETEIEGIVNSTITATTPNATAISEMLAWQQKELLTRIIYDDRPKAPIQSNIDNPNNQKLVILAGPHFTNAAEIQKKLWMWTTYNMTNNFTQPILDKWVWPIPLPVAVAEYLEMETFAWTPADIYYPVIEAIKTWIIRQKIRGNLMTGAFPLVPERMLFIKYNIPKIMQLFQENMEETWNLGYNLLIGTDAFNHVVTYPELAMDILEALADKVFPTSVSGEQTTIVISYRSPKSDHLFSAWVESDVENFHEWVKVGMLHQLNALGMVKFFLENTECNVALIDTKGVEEDGWDMSQFIACHIMKNNCDQNGIIGFDNEKDKEPILPQDSRKKVLQRLSDEAIQQIDEVLMSFDCNYKETIYEHTQDGGRLQVYKSAGVKQLLSFCTTGKNRINITDMDAMRKSLVSISKKY